MADDTRPLTEQWRQDLDGQWSHPQWWQAEQAQVAQVSNGGQTKQYDPRPHITTRKASRQAAPPIPYYVPVGPYYDAVAGRTKAFWPRNAVPLEMSRYPFYAPDAVGAGDAGVGVEYEATKEAAGCIASIDFAP